MLGRRAVLVVSEEAAGLWGFPEKEILEWASSFDYELYLVHSLVFAVIAFFLKGALPLAVLLPLNFAAAYAVGYSYNRILKICRWK